MATQTLQLWTKHPPGRSQQVVGTGRELVRCCRQEMQLLAPEIPPETLPDRS